MFTRKNSAPLQRDAETNSTVNIPAGSGGRKPSLPWRGWLKSALVTLACHGVIPAGLVSLCFIAFNLSEA